MIANTDNSVDRLKYTSEETYVCPSYSAYEMPLRAINTQGKWRIIVNSVKAHYETLSQTARIEECTAPGRKCPARARVLRDKVSAEVHLPQVSDLQSVRPVFPLLHGHVQVAVGVCVLQRKLCATSLIQLNCSGSKFIH